MSGDAATCLAHGVAHAPLARLGRAAIVPLGDAARGGDLLRQGEGAPDGVGHEGVCVGHGGWEL